MSFITGTVHLFPTEFIKECVATYVKDRGKSPKILVVSEDDYLDYILSNTIDEAKGLGLKVVPGAYLENGSIDLAIAIKDSAND